MRRILARPAWLLADAVDWLAVQDIKKIGIVAGLAAATTLWRCTC